MAMPFHIDPIKAAVSRPKGSENVSQKADMESMTNDFLLRNGKEIMDEFAALSAESTALKAKDEAETEAEAETDTDAAPRPPTLADIPFVFLQLEMDENGNPVEQGGDNGRQDVDEGNMSSSRKYPTREDDRLNWLGPSGHLGSFFTNKELPAQWSHAQQDEEYGADFPFSVNNIDCQKLVTKMEDVFRLMRGPYETVLDWAILAGAMLKKTEEGDQPGDMASKHVCRKRILTVEDLFAFLNELRRDYVVPLSEGKPRAADLAGGGGEVVIYFLAAVAQKKKTQNDSGFLTARHVTGLEDIVGPMFSYWKQELSGRTDDHDNSNNSNNYNTKGVTWPFLRSSCSSLSSDSEYSESEASYDVRSTVLDFQQYSVPVEPVEPEEPEEPEPEEPEPEELLIPSVLATLDTKAAKGSQYMEGGDLHDLLPEALSPTDEEWQKCCQMLCLSPEEHKNARVRSIKVPGTKNMMVTPSQLWTAYWMVGSRTSRDIGGGVLADAMGTGKTYTCLLVCLLRAYIAYSEANVREEWQRVRDASKAGKPSAAKIRRTHLPEGKQGSAPCPCGNELGIECYANPGGVTRQLVDTMPRGVSLIMVPLTVLDNWVKTIQEMDLNRRYFSPVVFGCNLKDSSLTLSKGQENMLMKTAVKMAGAQSQASKPERSFHSFVENYIFVTTHTADTFMEHFLRDKTKAVSKHPDNYACPVGVQFVDEFHKIRPLKDKTDPVTLARLHKNMAGDGGRHFDFWPVTGTPLPSRLHTNLRSIISILQRDDWEKTDHRHHHSRLAALEALQEAHDSNSRGFIETAERFLSRDIFMRHTTASTFFSQRIFDLPDVSPRIIAHETPQTLRSGVAQVVELSREKICQGLQTEDPEEKAKDAKDAADKTDKTDGGPGLCWDQAVRDLKLFSTMTNLEILATFPAAAPLLLNDQAELKFNLASLRDQIRKTKTSDPKDVPIFQEHVDAITADSPHMASILATVDAMAADREQGRLKKMVVLCPLMGEAVFVYLALLKRRPKMKPVFLHAGQSQETRKGMLKEFNRLNVTNEYGGKIEDPPRILVGTFLDAGTGNNLSVANYQIMTGPLRLASQMDQAFARTNRQGQTLPLHHTLLVTEDSPVDRLVMATLANRRIVSNPFDIETPLELAEN